MFSHLWEILYLVVLAVITANSAETCQWVDDVWPGRYSYCEPWSNYRATCLAYVDFRVRPCIVYDTDYGKTNYKHSLTITVKAPREENLFIVNLGNYKNLTVLHLFLEDGSLYKIPKDVFKLSMVKELTVYTKVTNINFNDFVSMSDLNKIYLAKNTISDIETDERIGNNSVKTLDISYNHIENIPNKFLKHFSMLRHLNITHNKISNIAEHAFEGLINLETLNLSHNNIYEIGNIFESLSSLLELSMANNSLANINSVNLKTLVNLVKLNISSNNINIGDNDTFSGLKNLQILDLNNNNIIAITKQLFINNGNLQSLYLSGNPLHTIESYSFEKSRLTNLQLATQYLTVIEEGTYKDVLAFTLDLSGGSITSIKDEAFLGMSDLKNLDLSSNAVETISPLAFKSLTSLNVLDLSHNKLRELNINSNSLGNLKKLSANDNQIEKIYKNVFDNLVSLEELNLSFNPIKEIEPFSTLKNIRILTLNGCTLVDVLKYKAFERLSSLQKIRMTQSRITVFQNESFPGLTLLQSVSSAYGNLEVIEYNAFLGSNSIQYVNFTSNRLKTFDINTTTLSYIKELHLNENRIRIIDSNMLRFKLLNVLNLAINNISNQDDVYLFKHLNSIVDLNISSNPQMLIANDAFQNMNHLDTLSLGHIKTRITFENSTASVVVLVAHFCGITDLNNIFVYNLQNLNFLDVSNNEITYINNATFKKMKHMMFLDLSDNKISQIQPGTFLHLTHLRALSLDINHLQTIQFGVFKGPKAFSYLGVSKNALQSFDVKLLPETETLVVDDNHLTHIDILHLFKTKISSLSIGGNPLSCQFLAEIKTSNLSETFNKIVKTTPLDYYSENVDGRPCRPTITDRIESNANTFEKKFEELNETLINIRNDFNDQLSQIRAELLKVNKNVV